MYFIAWAPLIADRTCDLRDWKLLRVNFSVIGMRMRPRKAVADCVEDDGSAMNKFRKENWLWYHVKLG
jgi:hypothetical protein